MRWTILAILFPLVMFRVCAAEDFTGDRPQWGGSSHRHNAATAPHAPLDWDIGEFDRRTGEWDAAKARNIKWVARLGSQSYSTPVVADGRMFVGTNNGAGHVRRYPADVDLACLLAFRESDGEFLWQYSSEKLLTGRVNDWPLQGMCSTPVVEGDRMWLVTNRCELVCLDTQGLYDGEDDGPEKFGWVRLVEHVESPPEVQLDPRAPPETIFETAPEQLRTGKLPPELRRMLSRLGIELPDELPIEEDMKRRTWSFKATPVGEDLPLPVDFRIEFGTQERRWAIDDARMFVARTITISATLTIDQVREADVVWKLDMMKQLGVLPHNMSTSSPTIWGDLVFAVTSNGVGADHITLPAPHAPAFIAVNKRTGKLVWSDNSPGENVLHGQWSSPAVGVLGGVPQVIFPGGDGWLYSFHAERHKDGKPELLWKFDGNPKDAKWILGGRGTRNNMIAMPVIHDGRVYITMGQDPEHGEGDGHLYCLDPTKRGDVSAELVVHKLRRDKPLPHRRHWAVDADAGEIVIANPNSAVVWHYDRFDQNLDGKFDFEETMHRSISCPVIKDDVLIVPDFSGLVHCLDARTGRPHWTCDLLAAVWGSPLLVNDLVYIPDEDGDIALFCASPDPKLSFKDADAKEPAFFDVLHEINMGNSTYSTPVMSGGVLYIASRTHLFAIGK